MRPPRVQSTELYLSSDTDPTSESRDALMNEARQLFETEMEARNLHGLGYKLLSTTVVQDSS